MSDKTLLSIIVASSSSIGKTFLIGLTGYVATRYPKESPLIPPSPTFMSGLSRLTFTMLLLPLIYEGIASSVEMTTLGSLYPVIIASFGIIGISFTVTVLLGYMPCFRLSPSRRECFTPLCVASTFPNIVALPIIIFPTLCEYEVTHDLVTIDDDDDDADGITTMDDESSSMSTSDMIGVCVTQANSVIFAYFFGYSMVIWTIGQYTLVNLGRHRGEQRNIHDGDGDGDGLPIERTSPRKQFLLRLEKVMCTTRDFIVGIMKLPSFQVLILAFITVCIPPLQRALFNPGGSMRVIGSALESLSAAGSTFATIVVAAALSPPRRVECYEGENGEETVSIVEEVGATCTRHECVDDELQSSNETGRDEDTSDIESNDTQLQISQNKKKVEGIEGGGRQEGSQRWSSSFRTRRLHHNCRCPNPVQVLRTLPAEDLKIYIWQITSRLFVTPAIIYLILIKLDCSGVLDSVPPIAKLVLLINSALPGALVIVVILKAEGLSDAAAIVSKTYLPTYVLSVFTLAMWSSIGLMTWRPESSICQRF